MKRATRRPSLSSLSESSLNLSTSAICSGPNRLLAQHLGRFAGRCWLRFDGAWHRSTRLSTTTAGRLLATRSPADFGTEVPAGHGNESTARARPRDQTKTARAHCCTRAGVCGGEFQSLSRTKANLTPPPHIEAGHENRPVPSPCCRQRYNVEYSLSDGDFIHWDGVFLH
jgi:hypothetical protein